MDTIVTVILFLGTVSPEDSALMQRAMVAPPADRVTARELPSSLRSRGPDDAQEAPEGDD